MLNASIRQDYFFIEEIMAIIEIKMGLSSPTPIAFESNDNAELQWKQE